MGENYFVDNSKVNDPDANSYYSEINEALLKSKLGEEPACENVNFSSDIGFVDAESETVDLMVAARFGQLFVAKNKKDLVDDQIAKFTCEKGCESENEATCFKFKFGSVEFEVT